MNEQSVQEIIDSYGQEIDRLQTELAEKDAKIVTLRRALAEATAVTLDAEAKLANANAAAHEVTNGYAAELWAWRAWAVQVADAWTGENDDAMERLLHNMPHQAITDTPD